MVKKGPKKVPQSACLSAGGGSYCYLGIGQCPNERGIKDDGASLRMVMIKLSSPEEES